MNIRKLAEEQRAEKFTADKSLVDVVKSRKKRTTKKAPKQIDKECDEITAFRWVAANVSSDGDSTKPVSKEDAPSRAAWNLFCQAQQDDDVRQEVWKKFIALGAKQDDNTGDRLGQSGRFAEKLLRELLDAVREEAFLE